MDLNLPKQDQEAAIASIKQFAREEMEAELSDLKAKQLFDFFIRELGPLAYNKGVHDAEGPLRRTLEDLSATVFEQPFTYWSSRKRR